MLDTVTLTGADDTVKDPKDLIALSRQFSFAEWGILVGSRSGVSRFPSGEWCERLTSARQACLDAPIKLSLHVCGRLLRDVIYNGHLSNGGALNLRHFGRMQLNFHGETIAETDAGRERVLASIKNVYDVVGIPEVIVQLDGVNDWVLDGLLFRSVKASGLYDRSHGTGLKPDQWPAANRDWKVGYAGGIGPETVVDDVRAILAVAGGKPVWIDMESRLYTNGQFDLEKCRLVLEACREFVAK